MRALVVDDDEIIRVILGKILQDQGFQVFEACESARVHDQPSAAITKYPTRQRQS